MKNMMAGVVLGRSWLCQFERRAALLMALSFPPGSRSPPDLAKEAAAALARRLCHEAAAVAPMKASRCLWAQASAIKPWIL